MTNSRKTVWIIFALFMFVQLSVAYMIDKNQNNLDFLLNMKKYIPFMLYFSLLGAILFVTSFMFYQLDNIKSKKLITQLENDKNQLKAKLFDMQEEKDSKGAKALKPKEEPKANETLPQSEEDNSTKDSSSES